MHYARVGFTEDWAMSEHGLDEILESLYRLVKPFLLFAQRPSSKMSSCPIDCDHNRYKSEQIDHRLKIAHIPKDLTSWNHAYENPPLVFSLSPVQSGEV
jgi:hypothetical protein